MSVPVQNKEEQVNSPANLIFEKSGYGTQERQFVELWSRGDSTYRIRLERGGTRKIADERSPLRRAVAESSSETEVKPDVSAIAKDPAAIAFEKNFSATAETAEASLPSNATVRVPRNIRVEDGGIIYYVTMNFYEKHVLPHEWIASWSSNSLNAGAVAVRCYAIGRVNGRSPTSDYDICGSSDCQNFKATSSATSTDKAVDYTAGYVMLNANGNIASTEYSAENNSLDKDCGDGLRLQLAAVFMIRFVSVTRAQGMDEACVSGDQTDGIVDKMVFTRATGFGFLIITTLI